MRDADRDEDRRGPAGSGAGDASGGRPPGPEGDPPGGDAVDERRRQVVKWLWRLPVLLVLLGGAAGMYDAIRLHFQKARPTRHPTFTPVPPVAAGTVATFGQVWSSVPIELTGARPIPAIVLRLPEPIPGGLDVTPPGGSTAHLAGFSRVCTFDHCTVYLNKDLKEMEFAFNFKTNHPALTCPCHLCIFDPTKAGQAVSGPARLPLPRLELRQRGDQVTVVGLERT